MSDVGIEWDRDACRTRAAAGHLTIRADVAAYPVEPFEGKVVGLIASPPCTAFSMAGKGQGREEIDHLHRAVEACRSGWVEPDRDWLDPSAPLVLEPLRWAWALRDSLEWVTCEQVPPVLELWKHMADVLRAWGFDADARKLLSEQYGVPQTRTRAILIAHRDGVTWPKPTHQKYRHGEAAGEGAECRPSLFGAGVLPWVSMAEALGWEPGRRSLDPKQSAKAGNKPRDDDQPAHTIRSNVGSNDRWVYTARHSTPVERTEDEPAPTIAPSHGRDIWTLRNNDAERATERASHEPAPTLASDQIRKATVRAGGPTPVRLRVFRGSNQDHAARRDAAEPAPTLAFGHARNEVGWVEQPGDRVNKEGRRLEVREAAVLQSFPASYPWQGSKTSQFSQIGNAVPPRMAAAVIGALTGRSLTNSQSEAA